jgi:DNA polymerase I-like protein with 3'-5' exonuclease and polymerase domains
VIDIHPDEVDQVLGMVNDMNEGLTDLVESVYGIRMNVPLLLEAKIGPNWLDTVDV